MKKSEEITPNAPSGDIASPLAELVDQVRVLVHEARRTAAMQINSLQVRTNYEIGRLIVEHEQQGRLRADYGSETLTHLAIKLSGEFGPGFSMTNLEYMRKFYQLWPNWLAKIPQTPSEESGLAPFALTLSWSHYVLLVGIRNENERRFYEIEAGRNAWSIREFKRQIASGLYERLALSRDKHRVAALSEEGQVITQPSDIMKDPYVLEFLGLDERPSYSENELESAIISKLEHFLLELGKGFLFEARQKRFTFDEDHFYVDLVFYNRLLRCYVLIDLKIDQLTHQDLGQMQMYVNYFDRFAKTPEENPTIGILLCKRKKDALVELTLPTDANIFASAYQLYLPSKEDLRKQLMDWADVEVDKDTP